MPDSPEYYGSLVFVVRLWRETDAEGHARWRGRVEHVGSQEVGYVEDVAGAGRLIERWSERDKEGRPMER